MRNRLSKTLAFILALAMIIAIMPISNISVRAASNPYPTSQTVGGVVTVPCTYYAWQQAYNRLGVALPAWGNAIEWYNRAKNAGYYPGGVPIC